MKFVPSEPALIVGKTLVIADLHLGVEHDYRLAGFRMPSQTEKLAERALSLIKKTKTKRLVVMGDVKHKVPGTSFQEKREIPDFFNRLSEKVQVEVVPGNHDGGLQALIPNIRIHAMSGTLIDDVYLCHGHSWPDPDFLDADFLVTSHNHPLIELKDRLGYRWLEKVWLRADLRKKAVSEKYKTKSTKLPELVVMPTFSGLVGGFAMNRADRKPLGPVLKSADLKKARAFLLDGTFLGELKNLEARNTG
jgi:hypothetical protein